jgi:hypothetical protein
MRTLRDCFIFLLIMVALLVAWVMMGVGSLRNPWSWILAVVGAAIFDGLTYLVYKSKARKKSAD